MGQLLIHDVMRARKLAPLALSELSEAPLVSVVITNYNYGRFVARAIESVLAQTYPNFELIVVDDGSKDDSCQIIERYVNADARVRLVRKANGGLASAWNAGYAAAAGEIFCPLDSDDMFYPHRLEQMVAEFRRNPRSALWVHPMTVVDAEDRPIQQVPFLTRFETGWIAETLLRRGGRWRYMPTSAISLRHELCQQLFPIAEETFRMHADALAVTLGPLLTEICASNVPLSYYRVHGANSLGGDVRDEASARKVINFTLQTIEGVNACLEKLGADERLDVEQNLEYLQACFVRQLFSGDSRSLVFREYRRMVAALLRDDLYRPIQKLMGIIVFGVAAILGRRSRAWWIRASLGYGRPKMMIQRLSAAVHRRGRPARLKPVAVPPLADDVAGRRR